MTRHAVVGAAIALALTSCTPDRRIAPLPMPSATASSSAPAVVDARFFLVGQDPLLARGMNAGLAVRPPYAYIGNRTDPSSGKPHPGVLVVDIGRPASPQVVGEIAPPPLGTSSRELRIWSEQDLLIVLSMRCEASNHRCSGTGRPSLRFYDIRGERARSPRLLLEHPTAFEPHEMYLWIDPGRPGRALLYVSTDTAGADAAGMVVLDISDVRRRRVREVARWSGNRELGGKLHSVGLSRDGTRAYLAHLAGGFAVLDTSGLARGDAGAEPHLLTDARAALRWSPGPHSAVPVEGTSFVLTTDEVYGGAAACPWGWMRLIDVADPAHPRIAGELRTARNELRACTDAPRSPRYSFSPHNPTVVDEIALVTWHGAGLVAASLVRGRLSEATVFEPRPLERVGTEDPRLTAGPVKVAMWSTPIVADGLIYVVDVRNGLYVLRYEGPGADAIARTRFAEGNSNAAG